MSDKANDAAMEAARDERYPRLDKDYYGVEGVLCRNGQRAGFSECWRLHVAPRKAEIAALRAAVRAYFDAFDDDVRLTETVGTTYEQHCASSEVLEAAESTLRNLAKEPSDGE